MVPWRVHLFLSFPECVLTFFSHVMTSTFLVSSVPLSWHISTNGRLGSPFLSVGSGTSMSPRFSQRMRLYWADTCVPARLTFITTFSTLTLITKLESVASTTDIASNAPLHTVQMYSPPFLTSLRMKP